jgi:SAM-dependent methyltransferase
MFFPDPLVAMREMRRVLKPRGRVALAVWASIEQPAFQVFVAPILRYAGGVALNPDGPNPFRFAEFGTLSQLLKATGFQDVSEEPRTIERIWPGSPEQAWEYFRDHSVAFVPLMKRVPANAWAKVTREVVAAVSERRTAAGHDLPAQIILASAVKG